MNRHAARSTDTVTTGDDSGFLQLASNQRVAHTEYGDPDGAPIVFLHGTPGSRLLARLYANVASEAGVPIKDVRRFVTAIPTAELREVDDADHLRTLLQTVPDVLEEHR
ncbi:hypothetical protein EGH21_15145 [Halomicroarcula sp. F13]|uniref:Alpha/beta hydrolase n=1 Tax=Haloarcula rubra TaxID=2487747 RepID=A0AAW4PV12_9EURY|nr:hypothetical protein [Halomicroarcula rubra]MBX0324365.1 hypothetical protein [Halomicroarcula rubra]